MAWYDTGTVSVTNGSTTVTGSGTNFIAGAQVGEGFASSDGRLYEIQAIVSATSLTLADPYLGSTQTGQDYKIVPTQSLVANLASQVSTLISDFQSVADEAGEGKFDDGSAASPGITFTLDQDTGFSRPAANQIGFSTAGVQRALLSSTALTLNVPLVATGDVTIADRIIHAGDTNTQIRFPANDEVSIQVAGSQRIVATVGGVQLNGDVLVDGNKITVQSNFPSLRLDEEDGTSTNRMFDIIRTNNTTEFRTLDSSGSEVAVDYAIQVGASGAINHRWNIEKTEALRIDSAGILQSPGGSAFVGTVATGSTRGAIIQRGSNANGEFVRFADGTQICVSPDFTGVNMDTAAGNIFRNASPISWTFPAGFSGTATIAGSVTSQANSQSHWGSFRAVSATKADITVFSGQEFTNRTVRASAIGRWF